MAQVFEKLGLRRRSSSARRPTPWPASGSPGLKAGNHYSAFFNPDASLASFEMTLDGSGRVEMKREGGRGQGDWQPFQRRVELRVLRGTLDGLAG